jgi:hypothetical protein
MSWLQFRNLQLHGSGRAKFAEHQDAEEAGGYDWQPVDCEAG